MKPKFKLSEKLSKKAGIAVGYVTLQIGPMPYQDSIHFSLFENFLSSDFTYQPETVWTDQEYAGTWGGYTVANAVTV